MVQMTGIRTLRHETCPVPVIQADEVLLEICYVGICGSDIHFFTEGHIGKRAVTKPHILGHEASAIVVGVGANVKDLSIGDRVAIEPGKPCGHCKFCLGGRYNLCPNVVFISNPPDDGALRRYMAYPASLCFKLPDNISLIDGAMIEPLSVGLHAAMRGNIYFGKTVAILGCGTIGIMTLLSCKAYNAGKIIVTDISDARLNNALSLGADLAVNSGNNNVEEFIFSATNGQGVDVVFEAAGNPVTMAQTIKLVARGGTIVVVGNVTKETSFDFLALCNKEVDIRPVYRYCNIFPDAIAACSSKKIDLSKIKPRVFSFSESQAAFDYAATPNETIKTIIEVKLPNV